MLIPSAVLDKMLGAPVGEDPIEDEPFLVARSMSFFASQMRVGSALGSMQQAARWNSDAHCAAAEAELEAARGGPTASGKRSKARLCGSADPAETNTPSLS